jgi:hypothetical protein
LVALLALYARHQHAHPRDATLRRAPRAGRCYFPAAIAGQIVELQRAHELLTHKISNYKIIEERIRVVNPTHAERALESALEPVV